MKQFRTKSELFAYLIENKDMLIAQKKSATKFTDVVSYFPEVEKTVTKAKYPYENDEEKGILKRTLVANTYNWMDTYGDVHLSGTFSRSIEQKGTKIFHLQSHVMDWSAKVGTPTAVYEKQISWRELGIGKTGMTEALFVESDIKKAYNEIMYDAYKNDEVDQHSVGMQYVNIALAVNDPDDYPREHEEWQKHIGKLGNRKAAEDRGFFWAVYEAKLIEVSAVLMGANELTPTLGTKANPSETLSFKVLDSTSPERTKDYTEALNNLLLKTSKL